jgi:hypothetical protein
MVINVVMSLASHFQSQFSSQSDRLSCLHLLCLPRYVILPKDFEKGYKANVKKGDTEFAFYQ